MPDASVRETLFACAQLEERSAEFLEAIAQRHGGPIHGGSEVATKVTIARKLTVASDKAWEAISRVGRLDAWFPTIATCTVEGDGVGANRTMTLHRGGEITDRIVDIDPMRRRLTYQRVRSPFPVTSYKGTVEVFESFDSRAVVVWTVDFESDPEHSVTVAATLRSGIGAGVEGMEKDLQGGSTVSF